MTRAARSLDDTSVEGMRGNGPEGRVGPPARVNGTEKMGVVTPRGEGGWCGKPELVTPSVEGIKERVGVPWRWRVTSCIQGIERPYHQLTGALEEDEPCVSKILVRR